MIRNKAAIISQMNSDKKRPDRKKVCCQTVSMNLIYHAILEENSAYKMFNTVLFFIWRHGAVVLLASV